jgi:hypothetical protein
LGSVWQTRREESLSGFPRLQDQCQPRKIEAMIKFSQEETKAVVISFWSELEETLKHQVEYVLAYVDQKTQGFCKELNKKIDEMQVDLQAVRTSVDTWTIRASWKL